MSDGHHSESSEVIAKEITLAAMKDVNLPGDKTPETTGSTFGKLYKVILKHVREAYNQKYD